MDGFAQAQKGKMMSDLISRQAAIDALDSIGSLDTDADREYARGIFNALPSAQPERKKPVFKTGESVYHVSYADGTGGFKKKQMGRLDLP